ncbi:MAG: bifunctional acetate--CoA ligase family protein/GNAT family N-acetyltransferase [Verrucomicrobiales bacterium]|nr:bifunctional acetate--CoA ligase family protein/GNAT family N-acetyltransferase [Verrucomicrobiales bacterium]
MTHYLSSLFAAKSVAVFGASERPESVGSRVLTNLIEAGFNGALFPVNPKHKQVQGLHCYPDIASINEPVELAVIATPAKTVGGILEQCGQAGIRAAIVLSAGFGEAGPEGKQLEQEILEVARGHRMRLLGPNCLGLIRPSVGMNATFGKSQAIPGELALVSQSGARCAAILDWAEAEKVGFSTVVSLGAAADLGFGEILDFLATDSQTRSILLYIEGIRDGRSFLSNLRTAARLKPVIVMKPGRHPAASRAAVSHTGAMVGADDVFDAALDRAGVVRVNTIMDLFSAARTLSEGIEVKGNRLTVVTNGGGPGVIAADAASDQELEIPDLSADTIAALNQALPAHWSRGNPIDVLGDAGPDRFSTAVQLGLDDPNTDGLLVMLTPQAMTDPEKIAQAVIETWRNHKNSVKKPVITCWMGERHVESSRRLFSAAGIPSFQTPESAVNAFAWLWHYHRNQNLLLEVPGPLTDKATPDIEKAKSIIKTALGDGRSELSSIESKALLAAFHIPVTEVRSAGTVEEAAKAAGDLGFPVVMKIDSPDLSHKSDVGGVQMNLRDVGQVTTAYPEMRARVREKAPEAELKGVTIERQWNRAHTRELLVGVLRDPVFGPVITFGWGGTAVEVLGDRAVCLPPLNSLLIRRMIARTRVARLLGPFRNLPPIDAGVLKSILLRLSEMVCELPEIAELDINPLSCDEAGACALDVRVALSDQIPHFPGVLPGRSYGHMAIPPYPKHLARKHTLSSGIEVMIRPIRPEDAGMEQRFVQKLSPEAKYFRFMQAVQELSQKMLIRFTQIDYDREMAFLASVLEDGAEVEIGIARYIINPDGESCEFAIVVDQEWQGRGIGTLLMHTLMNEAKTKQIQRMEGEVLADNHHMLELMRKLGFSIRSSDSQNVKAVEYVLQYSPGSTGIVSGGAVNSRSRVSSMRKDSSISYFP